MLFKKKPKEQKVIEMRHCTGCKREDNLVKSTYRINKDGDKVQYFRCNPCNSENHKRWYHNGNQKKAMEINARYRKNK